MLRIQAGSRDLIVDLARVYVALLHDVSRSRRRRLARSDRGLVQVAQNDARKIVLQGQAGHRHVAGVLYLDRIGHRVADLHALGLVCSLCNFDLRVRSDRRNGAVIVICDFPILRVLTCCSDLVVDAARIHVILRHLVGRSRSRRLVRSQRRLIQIAEYDAFQDVRQGQAAHRHVAGVLHRDRIGHGIADLDVACCGGLGYFNSGCRSFRRDLLAVAAGHFLIFRILTGGSSGIVDLASVNIALLHHVGRRCSRGLARGDARLVQSAQDDAFQDVRKGQVGHRHVARVLHRDRIGHGLADLHSAGLIRGLRYLDLRVRSDRRDGAFSVICHVVAKGILRGSRHLVHDLAGIHVILRHLVGRSRSRRLVRSQRRLIQIAEYDAFQDVRQGQAAHRHVAGILHRDRIGHGLAHGHAAVFRGLRDFNSGSRCDRRYSHRVRIRNRFSRRRIAGRFYRVHDAAGIHVRLGHRVLVARSRSRVRRKRRRAQRAYFHNARQRFFNGYAGQRHVAGVLHRDRVGDLVANGSVLGLARRLRHIDGSCRFNRRHSAGCVIANIVVLGIFAGSRYRVVDLAGIHVRLRYRVSIGNGLRSGRRQVERSLGQRHQRVAQRDVGHGHVAAVRHRDRIGHRVADLHVLFRVRGLRYRQCCGSFFCRYRRIRRAGHVGVLRILAGGGHGVVDLARVHVGLLHRVGIGDLFVCSGSQIERSFGQRHQRVAQRDAGHGHVAGIGHLNRVGNGTANRHVARRIRSLLDLKRRSSGFRIDRIAGFVILALQGRGHGVGEAACRHIGGLDGIGRRRGHARVRCHVLKGALGQGHPIDLAQGDGLRLGINVLYRNGKGYGLALGVLVIVSLAVVLGDDQRRINIVIGDLQRAVHILDIVVRCDVGLAVLHHSIARDVVLRADIRDRAGHGHAGNGVRALQTYRRSILPPVVLQRRAVIFLLIAVRGNLQRCLRDGQGTGDWGDYVVRRHVLFAVHDLVAFRNGVVSGRGISHVRHAAGGGRHQRIARQQAAFGHGHGRVCVRSAVVGPFLARRGDGDRHGGLRHGQLAVYRRNGVVAGRSSGEFIALHLVRYRALAGEGDASRHHCGDRVAAHQAFHVVLRPALRLAGIRERLVLRRDRHGLRIDRQSAGFRRDHVVRSHVLFAVHDLVAFRNGVVSGRGISHVRHAAGGGRHQRIARQQAAFGHGHGRVCVRSAVVGPFLARRGDGDRHGGLRHGQLAVYRRNGIVAGRSSGELIALHHVRHWALAGEGDASRHHRGDRVVAHQAAHRIVRVAVGTAVIGERFARRRDGHGLRRHGQGARRRSVFVVRVRGFDRVVDSAAILDARYRIAPGLAAVRAVLDRGALGHAGRGAARMGAAVVCAVVVRRSDRHLGLRDGQGAGIKGLGAIVSGDVFTIMGNRVGCRKGAGVGAAGNRGALGGGVGDGQDVAAAQAFHRIVIFIDRLAGAGDGSLEGTAFLLGAVIGLLDVLHRDRQGRGGDFQGAESRRNSIVAGFRIAPVDLIEVLAGADFGLGAGHVEGDGFSGAQGDRTGPRSRSRSPLPADVRGPVAVIQGRAILFRERRAVISLFIGRGGDRQGQGCNSQNTVTGIDRNRVVGISHHLLAVHLNSRDHCLLLRTGNDIGPRVFLGDQRAVRAVKGRPDRFAVLLFEQSTRTAGDADIEL